MTADQARVAPRPTDDAPARNTSVKPLIALATAAMLGMAGPLALGVKAGHAGAGVAAAFGGLALSSLGPGATLSERISTIVAGSLAMYFGVSLGGRGLSGGLVMLAVFVAVAVFTGISRPLGRALIQFIVYSVIAANIAGRGVHPLNMTGMFFLGAAWTAGLSLVLPPLLGMFRKPARPVTPHYPTRVYIRRWKGTLRRFSGWQYPLRLGLCLAAAQVYAWALPDHHGYWAAVTVLIVVQRNLQHALEHTLEQALGTLLGIGLISLFMLASPSLWAVIWAIGVLAAARPLLTEYRHAAYAAAMTPLVILLLDFGHPPSWAIVLDRLAATIAGCVMALTLGYVGWSRLALSTPVQRTPVS